MSLKILLAPVGSEGDIRPMVALAITLVARGHQVALAAAPDFAPLAALHRIPFHPVGSPFKPVALALSGRINGRPWSGNRVMLQWCQTAIREQFAQLGPWCAGVDRIVGGGLQFAASSYAESLGIRYRHVAHVPIVMPSRHHPPATVPWVRMPRWFNQAAWGLNGIAMNALLGRHIDHERSGLGLPPIGDFTSHFTRHMVIAMDRELGDLPRDVPSTVPQTGYWRIDDEAELDREVQRFLETGDPPVFFGFGSMGDEDPAATSRILSQTIRQSGLRAIIARGWASLEPDLDHRVLVIDRAPHGKLFPRVAAVVHHGGAGTTWATARAGVPHVVVPHLLDQNFWADRLQRLGVSGSPVPRRALSPETLGQSLREALSPSRRGPVEFLRDALASRDGIAEGIALIEAG
ncbi:MAG: glycosyltransferase family 1 protein [Fibrobacteria bacterium]|nr:glycosyltransferase family 1 protein [Fibrobacteria bacterium]